MSAILGIGLAALLVGLFTLLRARDRGGCTGGCVGCTGERCETFPSNRCSRFLCPTG